MSTSNRKCILRCADLAQRLYIWNELNTSFDLLSFRNRTLTKHGNTLLKKNCVSREEKIWRFLALPGCCYTSALQSQAASCYAMAAVSRKRRLTQECIETATRVMRIYDTMPYLQKPRIGSGGKNNFKTISSKQPSRALLCLQRHNNRLYCDRPIRSSRLLASMKSTNK